MLSLVNTFVFDVMTLHREFADGPTQVCKLPAGLMYPALAINSYDKAWWCCLTLASHRTPSSPLRCEKVPKGSAS